MIINPIVSTNNKPTSRLITLGMDNWGKSDSAITTEIQSNEQYVAIPGLTGDDGSQLIHIVPTSACEERYKSCGISCSTVPADDGTGMKYMLRFRASTVPTEELQVYVVVENLNLVVSAV